MKPHDPSTRRTKRLSIILIALCAALAVLVFLPSSLKPAPAVVSLSEAIHEMAAHKVASVSIDDHDQILTLTLHDGKTQTADFPFNYTNTLTKQALSEVPRVSTKVPPPASPLILIGESLLPVVVIVAFLMFMLSGRIGVGRFGKGRGVIADVPTTRFSDVAGYPEVVQELQEVLEFLHHPERFTAVGARMPTGFLLTGPPGTGKTLLARAVAGEAGVPFFAVSGSDFVETFVGVGAARVRKIFDKAKEAGPSIIFVDEIDAVARQRTATSPMGGTIEHENTLMQLLNEMDGFADRGTIVIAATNRPDVLDPALTRPGRLDRTIEVPAPSRSARLAILKLHARLLPLGGDVNLESIAKRSAGMTGADLAQVINESALEAARRDSRVITNEMMESAFQVTVLGRERRSATLTDRDQRIVAYHEAGHATVALVLPDSPPPLSVTIVPRGQSGGATWNDQTEDLYRTRSELKASLSTLLAGRAGEMRLLSGDFTQGAAGDLQAATALAQEMVARSGMGDRGLSIVDLEKAPFGETAEKVRAEIDALLAEALLEARTVIDQYQDLHEAVAEALLVQETLDLAELQAIEARIAGSGR